MAQCSDTAKLASETLVLVFDLVDSEIANSPRNLVAFLESDAYQKALTATLLKEGRRLMAEGPRGVSASAAEDPWVVLKVLGQTTLATAERSTKQRIETSSGFKQVEVSVNQTVCAFKASKTGIWISKNKEWLIVVAAGLGVGTIAAMYVLREGDSLAERGLILAKDKLKWKVAGKLELGASQLEFKPSQREFKLGAFVQGNFQGVRAKIDLRVATRNDRLASAGGSAQVIVPLGKTASLTGDAAISGWREDISLVPTGPMNLDYKLGLKLKWMGQGSGSRFSLQLAADAAQTKGEQSVGSKLGVQFSTKLGGIPTALTGAARAGATRPDGSQSWKQDYGMEIGVKFEL
ncbi:MAG: hypothetical protein JRG76_17005 [Deltaproteobacteria bacterium]|nr:hypothetical protein [Deltaproteobacteria bacterium]